MSSLINIQITAFDETLTVAVSNPIVTGGKFEPNGARQMQKDDYHYPILVIVLSTLQEARLVCRSFKNSFICD